MELSAAIVVTFKQNVMKHNLLYNIVLAGFGALLVGLLIIKGPPPTASPPATTSTSLEYSPLGVTPAQIRWYELRDGQTGLAVKLERQDTSDWRLSDAPQQLIDQDIAAFGAQVVASFAVRQHRRFNTSDDLSQFGLTTSSRYVVSFGINAYNNGSDVENFTLYIGTLTPDRQEYYAVFVDESDPDAVMRQGEWIYLIEAEFIDTLAAVMFDNLIDPQTS